MGWKVCPAHRGKRQCADVAPDITIVVSSPSNGSTITGPDVTVNGAVINTTGNETGITVNGIVANVYGNQFIADHVPLAEGSNTFTVTATDSGGTTASTAISVDAVAGDYIRLTSNIDSGISPLEVTLRIDGSFSIDDADISIEGPTLAEIVDNPAPDEYTVKFRSEGLYYVTASATGPDGNVYEDTITITVMNKEQLDRLLKAKWEGMKEDLINGETSDALDYFTQDSHQLYSDIFSALGTQLPQIIQPMQDIQLIYAESNAAKYRIRRNEQYGGQTLDITYYIYFTVDSDGMWKIYEY
jgi:Tfp pilus assembly protein PilX